MPRRPSPSLPHTDDLIRLVDRWKSARVVVVGDFMLDHHVFGHADRLSPDAPVPVLAVQREQDAPGGAANVCLDLRALRCDVTCLGVVGRDAAADRLRRTLKDAGCRVSGLVTDSERPTTVKHNFVGLAQHRHPQKMFRVDDESRAPVTGDVADRLLAAADKALRGAKVLCLEDYNKGVLTPAVCQGLIALAQRHGVPVLVDPAAIEDYSKYRGATCITPNRFEALLAATHRGDVDDEAGWHRAARKLLKDLKLECVAMTLDRHGALLVEKGVKPRMLPTVARSVYDVTGAGDMVLATMAGAIANGADWGMATALANVAAGLEVEKFGIVPIELDELLLALLQLRHEDLGKVRDLAQLLPELSAYRKQGRRIVFTNGCFDILHAGHVAYLREARRQGDLLVVAVNGDRSIRRIKGPGRPVNSETDRLTVLSELESVNYLVVFDSDTPTKLIEAIRPDVLVKGGDYQKKQVIGGDIVERYGGRVYLAPIVEGRSTTNLIQKMRSNG